MASYPEIQRLLDTSIGGPGSIIGSHQAFWRTQTRDQFVDNGVVFGEKLIAISATGAFDPDNSALIQALEARGKFGIDVGTQGAIFRRMPAGRTAMDPRDIQIIRLWILDGCPA